MLILWYAGRRREDRPLPRHLLSMAHASVAGEKNQATEKTKSSASRQMHFLRCTSGGQSQKAIPGLSLCPLPSFLPSFLRPSRPSVRFQAGGDVAPSSLLRCH